MSRAATGAFGPAAGSLLTPELAKTFIILLTPPATHNQAINTRQNTTHTLAVVSSLRLWQLQGPSAPPTK